MAGSTKKKVSSACQRCRRQKLKVSFPLITVESALSNVLEQCDIIRPCTLCRRAGVDCQPVTPAQWRVYQKDQPPESERSTKRIRVVEPAGSISSSRSDSHLQSLTVFPSHVAQGDTRETIDQRPASGNHQSWNSSSTMALVDGAFHLHNAATPESAATNAIPGAGLGDLVSDASGEEETPTRNPNNGRASPATSRMPPMNRSLAYSSQSAVAELVSLLPDYQAAALLVDTYFDRVHWFMLIFHQDDFRRRWPKLYRLPNSRTSKSSQNLGFISTFLMVIAIGLQYIGDHRRQLLATYGIDPDKLKERIFSAVRTRLLDIVSVGSLEVVEMCVLLGTYYLYHGAPRLAWPVCGCGLRIAQALGLHRKRSSSPQHSLPMSTAARKQNEARKRGWWAIYEIETFCSMAYGYPLSIKDSDCDVEPLDPTFNSPIGQSPSSFEEPVTSEATLLSYKYFMSKLSIITKDALSELYNVRLDSAEGSRLHHSTLDPSYVIDRVRTIDMKLRQWHAEVPSRLGWDNITQADVSYSSPQAVDRDIGASGPVFENHIYQLQALTLKLAYENAKILVHRPLLSYKVVSQSSNSAPRDYIESTPSSMSPFRSSLQTCRAAAMSMAEIASNPIVDLISETYAAAFVSIHTFTAGVTLGILSSIEPLGPQSRDTKIGMHRLMGIQEKLKHRSVLAAQGLEVLQRLARLVMEKELNVMLDVSKPIELSEPRDSGGGNAAGGWIDHPRPLEAANSASDAPVSATYTQRSSDTTCPVPGQQSEIPTADSTYPFNMTNENALQYMEDPALSEAIYDFDQALSTYAPRLSVDPEESYNSSLLRPPTDEGFPMLEQTWIWSLENIPP
ncbi:fungal-specific transcription factor domain-containing protein [Aspergillus caelatus]|uniref:Fungal-specific transcription factor domain-containing protein n=1 Tax=Aspergillus caelatus TaxID=61420 RepID=A0A5N7AMU3_9EURO|nr:fungal-specific transcription factor domain-containing protein [Aspergillus caelatus]KAE8370318.1 fungal-specific transcription factor domain-containing protein [Aspergillus caelatus]